MLRQKELVSRRRRQRTVSTWSCLSRSCDRCWRSTAHRTRFRSASDLDS